MTTKKKALLFEILNYLAILIIFGLYIFLLYRAIFNYDPTQSFPIFPIVLLYTYLFVSITAILFIVLKKITIYQKENEVRGILLSIGTLYKGRRWLKVVSAILWIFTVYIGTIIFIQDLVLFYPNHSEVAETNLSNLDTYQKITITKDKQTYSGWAKIDPNYEYTILYFGGNGESSARFFMRQNSLKWEMLDYANIIMIDYPGYGLSSGKPNEKTIKKMSLITYDYVKEMDVVKDTKIVVMGFSLGTGIASYVAANRDVFKLVLLAPYTSIIDVVNTVHPTFYGPMKYLWRSPFYNKKVLTQINCPTLVIYSNHDLVIKPKISQNVTNYLKNYKEFPLNGYTHNQLTSSKEALFVINHFIYNVN